MPTLAPPPFRGLFITGTDTGVGKTLVSCALLRFARTQGVPLLPYKPAESGVRSGRPRDALALRSAAGLESLRISLICPHHFGPAVAPAAVNWSRGKDLTLEDLVEGARRLARHPIPPPPATSTIPRPIPAQPTLIVEGAGGILSPYGRRLTCADLAEALDLPVVIVGHNRLGTINHTALAVAECRRRGLSIAAVILVSTDAKNDASRERNADLIEDQTAHRPDEVPHFAGSPATKQKHVAEFLRSSQLGHRLLAAATASLRPRALRARRRPSSGR